MSFAWLALLAAVLAVVAPPAAQVAAGPNPPGSPGAPPAPEPLSIPPSWYDLTPAAPVDYLPASSTVTPTGQFSLSIPIDTPPARGMGPSLAFSYGGTANGLLGVGWTVAGFSEITRCRKTLAGSGVTQGIHYTATDDFCLDGQRLVLVNDAYADGCKEYRTERDVFARVVGCGDTVSGPADFRVWTKGGQKLFYEGIHYYPDEEGPVDATDVLVAWPLRDAQDRSGNLVRYSYEVHQDTGGPVGFYYRPSEIEYTRKAAEPPFVQEEAGLRKVVFDYEPRPDPSNVYLGGIRYGTPERLSAVTLIAPNPETPEVVGRYELSYEASAATGRSLLSQIRRCDREDGPEKACLWAKELTWWQSERPDFEESDVMTDYVLAPEVAFFSVFDADGDGRDDLLAQIGYRSVTDDEPEIYLLRGSSDPDDHGFRPPILVNDPYSYTATFYHVDLRHSRPADIDGDGRFEILAFIDPPEGVAPYTSGFKWFRWNEATLDFESFGGLLDAEGPTAAQLTDFDGDGRVEMLRVEPGAATLPRWLLHTNNGLDLYTFQATDFWAFDPGRAMGVDLDGDGRGEIFAVDPLEAQEAGRLVPLGMDEDGHLRALDQPWVVQSQGPYSLLPVLADLGGDGLRDALDLFTEPKQIRTNAGNRFLAPQPLDLPGTLVDTSVRDPGVRVADFDGDGREDLLSLEAVNEVGEHVMRLFLSRADGFVTRDLGFLSGFKAPEAGWTTTQLGDFNGDGWLDIVRMPAATTKSEGGTSHGQIWINVLLQKPLGPAHAVSDLLFEVKDEHAPAARTSVFYTTDWSPEPKPASCDYPQICIRRGFPVVRMVATSSIDPPATRWTFYEYEDPRADLRGRGFLGFGAVRAWDPQLRSETITTFDHQTRIGERYPFAGLPKQTTQIVPLFELEADAGEWPEMPASPLRGHVTSIHHTYSYAPLNGGATYFTPVQSWSRTEFEADVAVSSTEVEVLGPGGAEERRTEGTMLWDAFGNPIYDLAYTWGGSARLTLHAYDNLPDDWHIGLLRQSLESAGALGSLPAFREVTHEYDERGRLERTTVEPNDPELRRRTHYFRNGDGLVERVVEGVAGEPLRTTYFAFDDKERMSVRAVWNDLAHYRRMAVHPAFGVPLVTEDPNGVQVRRRYDTFGRVVKIEPDGGAAVEVEYAADVRADPSHPHGLAVTEKSATGAAQTTYLDEWGRPRETAALGFDGQTIVQRTEYNAFGQPVRVSRPAFGAASALWTETTFDTLGRAVEVVRPNGDHAETVYSMFEILRWDFDHHLSRLRLDQDGRAVESARFDGHWIATRYGYGDFGELTDVWDAEDNHTEIEHDRLGRRTRLDDPDKGISTYRYNGFGELREQDDDDPATPLVELHRDVLGRVTSREDADGTTEYTWDGPGALGKPWTMTSPDGVTTVRTYDAHGRPWKTTWTLASPAAPGLGDGSYEIERVYDAFGRVAEIRYPEVPNCAACPRFAAGFTYTASDYLHQVTDARVPVAPPVFWQVEKRNADDLLVQSGWAPSLVSIGKKTPEETRSYDPLLGRLESIVTTATGGEVFHLGYGYDPNGNVTSRTDPVIGRTETLKYDASDRLKSWTLDTGDKLRSWGYGYDDLDNLETVTEDGAPSLTHTYGAVVPGVVKMKPHALETISGAVTHSYQYDARGRQIEGGNRGITWTDFDLPRLITHAEGEAVFDYDALGTRVRKTHRKNGIAVASTITLAGLYERREDTETATVEHVFYVPGEGGPIAQVLFAEQGPGDGKETTRYLQHDGLGSVALVFDHGGTVDDRRFFEPFGQRIAADGGPFAGGMGGVELGFTGHRHDTELGLIDMRGRIYDPLQKHFLTPDPILSAPLSGQDYNQYSYAWNNPLSIVDPTGLQEAPAPGGIQIPLGFPTSVDQILQWLFPSAPKAPPPKPAPAPKGETTQKPATPTPTTPKTDGQGSTGPTGPTSLPTPQEKPPAAAPQQEPRAVDDNGFAPYNADQQRAGGFAAGVSIGLVPFGSLVVNTLIANGILAQGTPEAREGLAAGQAVGGILGLFWGGGKAPSAAPLQAPRPVPATVGGGSSPPLVVMPDGVGVLVGVGGAVTIATAVSELAVALSTGGGGDSGASSGGSAASAATGQHASGNGLADLSKLRAELGAKPGEGAVARLDVAGRSFYGINAHGQPVAPLRINAISATHAEADVFAQAARAGVKGGPGKLFVDRPLCASCGTFGGVRSMARQLGLESLEVVTPNGTFVITP